MRKLILKTFFISGVIFVLPFFANAATGDVLAFCDFQGGGDAPTASQAVLACTGASLENSSTIMNAWSNIELSGGADGGRYMKVRHPNGVTETAGKFTLDHANVQGVTYVWWEKFDQWPITGANIKSIRPYTNTGKYIGAVIAAHCPSCTAGPENGFWYVATWDGGSQAATFTATDIITMRVHWSECSGTNPYLCTPGTSTIGSRLEFNWSTDGGETAEFGTDTWHKVRMYWKTNTFGQDDGAMALWFDDQLALSSTNIQADGTGDNPSSEVTGGTLFSSVALFPAEDSTAGVDYYHSIDNFTAYEGYVEPGGADIVAPASPSGLSIN